jgi:hypothetical protein
MRLGSPAWNPSSHNRAMRPLHNFSPAQGLHGNELSSYIYKANTPLSEAPDANAAHDLSAALP